MPIQTRVNRPEAEIHSQNKVVNSYAQQLKSAVISNERKKAILKEMQSELTVENYYRPITQKTAQSKKSAKEKSVDSENISIANSVIYSSAAYLELQAVTQIQTGGQVTAPKILKAVDRSYIKTQRSTDYIKTARITYSDNVKAVISTSKDLEEKMKSADEIFRRKAVLRNMQIKQMRLKSKKYTIAKADSENSLAIESVQTVEAAVGTVSQAGGMLKTAVKGTSKDVGTIHSMVKNGVKIGSAKDVGRIATSVGGNLKNIAKDTGHQLLKTKIDKSTVTDTGTETIKQGLTELRYADNARKAVLNTARSSVKAGYAVKNMPKNTRAQVQRIKKNAQRAKKAAQKAGEVIRKVLTSKTGLIILLILALLLIVVLLLGGIISSICSAIGSLFSWMAPDGDTSEEAVKNNISSYISEIQQCETDIQAEIDAIVNGLDPEYRYDGSQIDGLNQFGSSDLQIADYNAVLAVLATQKYQKVLDGGTEDFSFTEEEIRNAVELFYTFNYRYEYDYCPDWDCSKDENCLLSLSAGGFSVSKIMFNSQSGSYEVTFQGPTYTHVSNMTSSLEIYTTNGGTITGSWQCNADNGTWTTTYNFTPELFTQIDWNNVYLTVTTIYCNNPNHCYLYGEVINYDIETVLQKAGFDEEEKELYEIYYAQICAVSGV